MYYRSITFVLPDDDLSARSYRNAPCTTEAVLLYYWDIYLGFGAPVIVIRDGYNFDSCGDFDSWLPNSIRDRDP